jgi:hypothetical protein
LVLVDLSSDKKSAVADALCRRTPNSCAYPLLRRFF